MKHTRSRFHNQRGEIVQKLMFVVVAVIAFYFVKGGGGGAKIKGKMDYALVAEFGEPVSKRTVPRPH